MPAKGSPKWYRDRREPKPAVPPERMTPAEREHQKLIDDIAKRMGVKKPEGA